MTMLLRRHVFINRAPDEVFALVADVGRYPEFLRGMTRWQPVTDEVSGMGACFKVLMQVGSIEAGGVVCTTEWEDGRTIAWKSERGIQQWGRWRVRPLSQGTRLALEVGFQLAGPLRWPVERLTGRIVDRNLQATMLAARRLLELEEPQPRT